VTASSRHSLSEEDRVAVALFALTALLIIASRWFSPSFGTWQHAMAVLVLSSFTMVVAFGQQMVVLTRGLDLSVASVMTLGGILTFGWVGADPKALAWGVMTVVLITGLVGTVNGVGVALLKIPPFIMTLATGIILYSAMLGITHGAPRGTASPMLSALFTSRVLGVPPIIHLMIVMTIFGSLLQRRTVFGRRVFAVGTNPQAAHLAGLPVRAVTICCYTISGLAAGFAGTLMVGYSAGATLTMGEAYLIPSIAAVVIGGTSILGGRGQYLGAVAGAVLLTTFSTIIRAIGIAEGWRIIIYGALILVTLILLQTDVYAWFARRQAALAPGAVPQSHGKRTRT